MKINFLILCLTQFSNKFIEPRIFVWASKLGSEIDFLTLGGAIRLPFGLTVGTKVYHDFAKEQTPEWTVVGLYQNPCRCWSLGTFFTHLGEGDGLPERNQWNFFLTLRGVGSTKGNGVERLQSILGPVLKDEPGMPWSLK